MAIDWPASLPLPQDIGFAPRFVQDADDFLDGGDQVNRRYARLAGRFVWPHLDHDDGHALGAFLGAGQVGVTTYNVPIWSYRQRIGSAGGGYVAGAAAAGVETLSISGGSGSFAAGDWIGIAGQAYQIHAGGSSSIKIVGGLRIGQGGGSVMTYLGDAAGTTLVTCAMVIVGEVPPIVHFPSGDPGFMRPLAVEFESRNR